MSHDTLADLRHALEQLTIAVAYTDHWLRDTDAFARACRAINAEYRPGKGLFVTTKLPDPWNG